MCVAPSPRSACAPGHFGHGGHQLQPLSTPGSGSSSGMGRPRSSRSSYSGSAHAPPLRPLVRLLLQIRRGLDIPQIWFPPPRLLLHGECSGRAPSRLAPASPPRASPRGGGSGRVTSPVLAGLDAVPPTDRRRLKSVIVVPDQSLNASPAEVVGGWMEVSSRGNRRPRGEPLDNGR